MSAVLGVAVAGIAGDSAESTAWDNDDNASMGGSIGALAGGGDRAIAKYCFEGDVGLYWDFRVGL